jgi:hypothetical protein
MRSAAAREGAVARSSATAREGEDLVLRYQQLLRKVSSCCHNEEK